MGLEVQRNEYYEGLKSEESQCLADRFQLL